mmetsp:Transcript_29632/g.46535  ORF Transcript_29632/g.46535 Transcript_29632/m.46535 type:complete len:81 (-) Transcript_29632:1088-1330(-)
MLSLLQHRRLSFIWFIMLYFLLRGSIAGLAVLALLSSKSKLSHGIHLSLRFISTTHTYIITNNEHINAKLNIHANTTTST